MAVRLSGSARLPGEAPWEGEAPAEPSVFGGGSAGASPSHAGAWYYNAMSSFVLGLSGLPAPEGQKRT